MSTAPRLTLPIAANNRYLQASGRVLLAGETDSRGLIHMYDGQGRGGCAVWPASGRFWVDGDSGREFDLVADYRRAPAAAAKAKHLDVEYIQADPFQGDEAELTCRTVAIRKARKTHTCLTLDGKQDHQIQPGERYRYEQALVDGDHWGSYRICLSCMDRLLDYGLEDGDD